MEERDIKFLNGPITRSWGRRTACFADPDGHLWGLRSYCRTIGSVTHQKEPNP
ncbi:hypothetical protein ABE504_20405 [Paenibacillus oryzisoli]